MTDDATSIRIEAYFTPYNANRSELLGTLKVTRIPGTTSVTLTSRKWKNCILNWKKFLFDVLPVTVGVVTTIPSSAAAAAIVSLQAFKAAVDTLQIELPREAAELVLRLATLQRGAEEDGHGPWIPLADLFVSGVDSAEARLVVLLRDLERLGVVRLDLSEQKVRVVEEIRFVDA